MPPANRLATRSSSSRRAFSGIRWAQWGVAPVAQWIEQRFPKPRALVRFRPGALPNEIRRRACGAMMISFGGPTGERFRRTPAEPAFAADQDSGGRGTDVPVAGTGVSALGAGGSAIRVVASALGAAASAPGIDGSVVGEGVAGERGVSVIFGGGPGRRTGGFSPVSRGHSFIATWRAASDKPSAIEASSMRHARSFRSRFFGSSRNLLTSSAKARKSSVRASRGSLRLAMASSLPREACCKRR
jgi:hypothetical protein